MKLLGTNSGTAVLTAKHQLASTSWSAVTKADSFKRVQVCKPPGSPGPEYVLKLLTSNRYSLHVNHV